ncbi:MAG: hypothetical protein Roseis2KO_23300 [Roseivirga sp.]
MKVIVLSLFLTLSISAAAQQAEITGALNSYFKLIEERKISEALDYVHPDLINMIGKEMFEQQYDQLFNSPGMEVKMDQFAIDTISTVHEHESVKYSLVDYSFQMTFKVDVSKDSSGLLPDILLSSYQTQFGKENVSSEVPGTYLIHVRREMFAIRSDAFEGWKILDYEKGMRIILVGIIPEDVLTHFNK